MAEVPPIRDSASAYASTPPAGPVRIEGGASPLIAVLDALPEIVHVYDAEWRWIHINVRAAEWLRSLGRDPDALLGRCVWEEFPAAAGSPTYAAATRAVSENREVRYEMHHGGRLYETRIMPYADGAVSLTRDVTQRWAEERRRSFLAEAGAMMTDRPTPHEVLPRLVRLATGLLADCAIAWVLEDGRLVRVATAHVDPQRKPLLHEIERLAPLHRTDPVVARVLNSGVPVRIGPDDLRSIAITDEHMRLARSIGLASAVLLPVVVDGEPVGILAVATDGSGRLPLDDDTVDVLGEVARRAGLALALASARHRAEEVADRLRRLQRATSTLSGPLSLEGVLDLLVDQAVDATSAYMGAVYEIEPGEGDFVLLRHVGLAPAIAERYQRLSAADVTPVGDVGRTGQPVFVESAAAWRERYGVEPRRDGVPVADGAWVALPLFADERLTGAMVLGFERARRFEPDDREFLTSLADQCAQTLARSRANQALRESEERFRATFERAGVGIAHVDLEGRWRRVNQRICEIVGYTRDELFALTFQDITHPDDLAADLVQLRRMMAGRLDLYDMEKRYLRKDGISVWVHLTVSVVRTATGAARYFIAVVEDIDRRKRMEAEAETRQAALELERRRLRAVLDLLPAGVWIASADGNIVEANSAAQEIWGGRAPRSRREEYHQDYRAFWPDGRPVGPGEWGLSRALAGQRTGPEEVVIEAFDRSRRTILNYGIPIRTEDAEVAGAVALSVDITDRKQVEQSLRRATRQLAILFRATSGLLAADRPTELLGDILEDLRQLIGVDVCFHYLADDPDARVLRLEQALGVGPDIAEAWRQLPFGTAVCGTVARDREPIIVEDVQVSTHELAAVIRSLGVTAYACFPLTADDRLLGTLSFGLRDRTRFDDHELSLLKALSEQLAMAIDRARSLESEHRARRLAEEASRAKSGFMATVSHELRTPLNAVIGYASLLQDGIPEPVGEGALRQVERIRIAATHLLQLIEEVLTFSRLESGREHITVERVALADLVREVRAVAEPLAASSGLAFAVHTPDDPVFLHTDPRKLRQILLNLVGNALKFTDEGEVSVAVHRAGADIVFSVSDTGIGIRDEHRHRLFEPFWQADASMTRRAQGTGLGLSISHRFIQLLGGEITVESEPGVGSTFAFRLPLRPPDA